MRFHFRKNSPDSGLRGSQYWFIEAGKNKLARHLNPTLHLLFLRGEATLYYERFLKTIY